MLRVVIIGGGLGGINTAQALAKSLTEAVNTEIIVLEKNAYSYHVVGAPRAYECRQVVRIVRGVATQISADTRQVFYNPIDTNDKKSDVVLTLRFDYLVLAMGSTYSVPIKPSNLDFAQSTTEAKLREVRDHIKKAKTIIIVGGGSVGCEVAAEIKARHLSKAVVIVDANSKLVSRSNLRDKFYVKLNALLAQLGVKVLLGERLEERLNGNGFERRTLQTDKSTEIESDIQLLCGGFHPVADLVRDMDPSLLTERGAVKVNAQLQLEGTMTTYANMFALGDVCNHPSPKMAFIASEQGKYLARELTAVIQKKQAGLTKPFVGATTEAIILPLGPSGGVTQLPFFGGIVLGGWFTKMIKSKDYFAGQVWASVGATAPK